MNPEGKPKESKQQTKKLSVKEPLLPFCCCHTGLILPYSSKLEHFVCCDHIYKATERGYLNLGCYGPPPQGVRMQQMRTLLVEPSAHRHTDSLSNAGDMRAATRWLKFGVWFIPNQMFWGFVTKVQPHIRWMKTQVLSNCLRHDVQFVFLLLFTSCNVHVLRGLLWASTHNRRLPIKNVLLF